METHGTYLEFFIQKAKTGKKTPVIIVARHAAPFGDLHYMYHAAPLG